MFSKSYTLRPFEVLQLWKLRVQMSGKTKSFLEQPSPVIKKTLLRSKAMNHLKKSCSWIEKFQLDVSQSRSSVENTMKASIICLVVLVAVGLKSCLSAVGVGVGVGKQSNLEEELPVRLEWVQEDLHSNQHLLAIFITIVVAKRSSFRAFHY